MRRTRQEGSALEDCGDAWRFRYRLGNQRPTEYIDKKDCLHNGKPSIKKARDIQAAFMAQVNAGQMKPAVPKETFGSFAAKWQEQIMPLHKPSSIAGERSHLKAHLVPAFGSTALADMTAESLQAWFMGKRAELSPKMLDNLRKTLKTMWIHAKAWGYVTHNPFEGLRLPTVTKGNVYHFSAEQMLAIINAASGWYRTFFWVLAETGMRPGECAGLTRADVGPRTLTIRQSIFERRIQTPKTPNAFRTVAISLGLAEELRRHIEERNPRELLFTTRSGGPVSATKIRSKGLLPVLEKLGIKPDKRAGLYAFRHGNLTLMDKMGAPLKIRQQRAGHSDPSITLAHYTHAVTGDDLAMADRIGELLNPTSGGTVQ